MIRNALPLLPVFLSVAEHRSFTAGARSLGMSPSAASQAVARLERDLGAPLFVRTTRSVNLTEVGARLEVEARTAVRAAEAAMRGALAERDEIAGVLRLNVPRLACVVVLPPLIAAFVAKHPAMHVEVAVEDRNVDIVREGFDAGVRLREAVEADMVTTRISPPVRFVVVGSKSYLDARGRPQHPRELVRHACIAWRSPTTRSVYRWEFEHRGRSFDVAVGGAITANGADLLVACAREGLGLTYVAEHEVREELAARRLETVLDAFCPRVPGLFLYYPRAAQRVPKVAAFVACARAELSRPVRGKTGRAKA